MFDERDKLFEHRKRDGENDQRKDNWPNILDEIDDSARCDSAESVGGRCRNYFHVILKIIFYYTNATF